MNTLLKTNKQIEKILNKPVSFSIKNYQDKIYLVFFKDYQSLCSTFMRIQEFQDSPKYRNKIFSGKEFFNYYRAVTKNDSFTYFEDWAGFNVSDKCFTPFFNKKFNPLYKREQKLLKTFKPMYDKNNTFYVLGLVKGTKKTEELKHELAHALFYLDPEYKRAVLKALKPYKFNDVKKVILGLGYSKSVLYDEIHAYVAHDLSYLVSHYKSCKKYSKLSQKLRSLFKLHINMRLLNKIVE